MSNRAASASEEKETGRVEAFSDGVFGHGTQECVRHIAATIFIGAAVL